MPKLSIIDIASDRPTPMQGYVLPTLGSAEATPKPVGLEIARWVAARQLRGTIQWPRAFGIPEGPVSRAFAIRCYAHRYVRLSLDGRLYTALRIPTPPDEIRVAEGPHDERVQRVTFDLTVTDPEGWLDTDRDARAYENTIEIDVTAPWPAAGGIGPGRKLVAPDRVAFVHPRDGLWTLPPFVVVHLPD